MWIPKELSLSVFQNEEKRKPSEIPLKTLSSKVLRTDLFSDAWLSLEKDMQWLGYWKYHRCSRVQTSWFLSGDSA